jgi:nitrate reductase beta subunit
MDVRAQIAMVYHLDKCLGCHTCSVACKNIWTDRRGAEYMWWNNVETKPGTGYPTRWEDQDAYAGGWDVRNRRPRLRSTGKGRIVANIFHHPHMPTLDEYYEPWTYDYASLFEAPQGTEQPAARPISLVTGKPLDVEAGPNWDDDLGGSAIYAAHDPNLDGMSADERRQLLAIERLAFFYLPRTCNHCLNPACVAACPSAAMYKRGEDGVVLGDQDRCRAWRACVAACPYKKTYYNWDTSKSEKCILCFPRLESGEAPACFHSCVGRIRYVGVLLYDASRIAEVAAMTREDLVEGHRSLVLNPFDRQVIAEALRAGIPSSTLDAAQRSPVYPFVGQWRLALPLHVEWRTLPMLFYVPPMSPLVGNGGAVSTPEEDPFRAIEEARVPLGYLATLFGAGNEAPVRYALRKQAAVRWYRRALAARDRDPARVERTLSAADCTVDEAEGIYRLTALCSADERFVVPPAHREVPRLSGGGAQARKEAGGFGAGSSPVKGTS